MLDLRPLGELIFRGSAMKKLVMLAFCLASVCSTPYARAAGMRQCSTEKINHRDCVVIIDRRYPVTLPTIQMAPGKAVTVEIQAPFAFETLSLDEASAIALPASDQGAALLATAIPDLKGLVWSNVTAPNQSERRYSGALSACRKGLPGYSEAKCKAEKSENDRVKTVTDILSVMRGLIDSAQNSVPTEQHDFFEHVRIVYAQLNQILSPIPKPGSEYGSEAVPPLIAPDTPDPWNNYPEWRQYLLCELGGSVNNISCPPKIIHDFTPLLSDIGAYQHRLPTEPPAAQPDNAFFDQVTFDGLAGRAKKLIHGLNSSDRATQQGHLDDLQGKESNLNSYLAVLATTLTSLQKDFLSYYQNIYEASSGNQRPIVELGTISDPRDQKGNGFLAAYSKLFGRQVAFNVNAVNSIATPLDSVTTSGSKTTITSITVLYGNPIFETSAGVIFSFVHNRTFANQTFTTPPPGSTYVAGDAVVYETKTTPEVVPFIAAHWRVGPEFAPTWLGHRRVAFYGTTWLGVNPYQTVPEYGAGPTVSWRSFMFSALYSRAHESVLVPPVSVGQVVCGPPSITGSSPPTCASAPAAPVTQTRTINAFAIGISIRIPTSFASGTGGISR